MDVLSIIFGTMALVFLILFVVFYFVWEQTRARLAAARRQTAETGNFFDLFSRNLRKDTDLSTSMTQAAKYIRELVMAHSVCIYRIVNGKLYVAGVSGRYMLSQETIMLSMECEPELFEQSLREEEIAVGEGFIGRVAARREPILLKDAMHDEHLSEFPMERLPDQVMAAPICRNGELSGVVCAVGSFSIHPFRQEQFEQLQSAAEQVRLIQELEDSYSARREQERLDQELGFARKLQSALLPEEFPEWDDMAVYGSTDSAKEVNGDFYDFVEIDDDRMLVVLGDACGKGVPACLLASMARSFIRAATEHFTTLEALLREVNRNLYRDTDAERFVTVACCLLDRKHHMLEYARAGHTELITFVRNHIRRLYPEGTGLGILPDEFATFDTICTEMAPGMSLLLYSDGMTEALNFSNEEFGVDRLAKEFETLCRAQLGAEEVLDGLFAKVREYEPAQHDDRTAILIRRR